MRSSNNLVQPEELTDVEHRLKELMVDKAVSPHKIKQVMYDLHHNIDVWYTPSPFTLKHNRAYFAPQVKKRPKVRSSHPLKRRVPHVLKSRDTVTKDVFFNNIDRIQAMEKFAQLHAKFEDRETDPSLRLRSLSTITPFHTKPLKRKVAIISEALVASLLASAIGGLITFIAFVLLAG